MKTSRHLKIIPKTASIILIIGGWDDVDNESEFSDDFEEDNFEDEFADKDDDEEINVKYRRHNELEGNNAKEDSMHQKTNSLYENDKNYFPNRKDEDHLSNY